MILIPSQNKQFTQNNKSDLLGNIWSSFNLDLSSNPGRIRLSPRLMVSSEQAFVSTISSAPCAFKFYNNAYWAVAGTKVHTNSSTSLQASFTADATSSTPTTCDVTVSDMEVFNSELYVSTASNTLYYYDGASWSSISIGSASTDTHMMTTYSGYLYWSTLQNKIYQIDTSHTSSLKLTIGTTSGENVITWMRAASNRIWIGTVNTLGGKGYVYEWDGVSRQVSRAYRLESQGALACSIKDDIPYIVDTNGRLLVYSGGTFQEVARFPTGTLFLTKSTSSVNDRFIHPNGMSVIEGKINILINNKGGDYAATIKENLPSGIWEYDPNIGLYHKYAPTYYDDDGGSPITDYGQNKISAVGALADFKKADSSSSANGSFLAGITLYTNVSSTNSAIMIDDSNDTVQKYGYFVTTWIDSANLKDTWNKIYTTYRKFLDSSDKIVLKYRQIEDNPTEISITWSSTNSFTTTTDLSGNVGDEIEILQGQGGGLCAHITNVTTFGSTYIVTIDETLANITNGNTAKARLQSWIKIGSITDLTTESKELSFDSSVSERIQLKVCMLFKGKDQLHRVALINVENQKLI